jgi:hypothetical protein
MGLPAERAALVIVVRGDGQLGKHQARPVAPVGDPRPKLGRQIGAPGTAPDQLGDALVLVKRCPGARRRHPQRARLAGSRVATESVMQGRAPLPADAACCFQRFRPAVWRQPQQRENLIGDPEQPRALLGGFLAAVNEDTRINPEPLMRRGAQLHARRPRADRMCHGDRA